MYRPVLREGTRGDAVRRLQGLLNARLAPPPRLVPDGAFGALTAAPVPVDPGRSGGDSTGGREPAWMIAARVEEVSDVRERAGAASRTRWGAACEARPGAIAVIHNAGMARTSLTATGNHVGFLAEQTGSNYKLLGGNQSDRVKESSFSRSSWQLKGYRWPAGR